MSATSNPPDDRVVCVLGRNLQCAGDTVVGFDELGLAAWALDTGLPRWQSEIPCLRFALVGDEVHGLVAIGPPRVAVFDLRSGELVREVELSDLEGFELSNVFAVLDGAYVVAVEGALQRCSLADGAVLAGAVFEGFPTGRGFSPSASVVCVAGEGGGLAAFAPDTLARLWLREDFEAFELRVAGDVFVVAGELDEAEGYALFALDARTGRTLWGSVAFTQVLACSDDVVLAGDRHGWLVALEARTGVVRWRRFEGAAARSAARVPDGFVTLVGRTLTRFADDGEVRARRAIEADDGAELVVAPSGAIVVCASRVGEVVARDEEAPLRTVETYAVCAPGERAPMPGRSRLTPSFARFEEARAVIQEVRDLDEAWEALAVRGVIPPSWVDDPQRKFGDDATSPSWKARPTARGAMLAFAADVEGVERVEALWRACVRRFGPFAEGVDAAARWANITNANAFSVGHFEHPTEGGAWRALTAALPAETLYAIEDAMLRDPPVEGDPATDFELRLCDAAWRTAARAGLTIFTADPTRRALRVDAAENPYETLREIRATGYLVDAAGVLRARRFDQRLRALEAVEDEIPF
jgi:PQQ-like domain